MSNEIIWKATLDEKYECVVERTGTYQGRLTVTENDTAQNILDKDVSLSYGASFGPDVTDIAEWQLSIIDAIDNIKK
jgi:hypothetical protein